MSFSVLKFAKTLFFAGLFAATTFVGAQSASDDSFDFEGGFGGKSFSCKKKKSCNCRCNPFSCIFNETSFDSNIDSRFTAGFALLTEQIGDLAEDAFFPCIGLSSLKGRADISEALLAISTIINTFNLCNCSCATQFGGYLDLYLGALGDFDPDDFTGALAYINAKATGSTADQNNAFNAWLLIAQSLGDFLNNQPSNISFCNSKCSVDFISLFVDYTNTLKTVIDDTFSSNFAGSNAASNTAILQGNKIADALAKLIICCIESKSSGSCR